VAKTLFNKYTTALLQKSKCYKYDYDSKILIKWNVYDIHWILFNSSKTNEFCAFQISYLILMRNILWADTYYTQGQLKI